MAEAPGVLGAIAAHKKEELAARFDGVELDHLRGAARSTSKSLAQAVGQRGARFILEVKKGSPSEGSIRAGADPAAIARGYAGVADALSVLCDRRYFGGSLEDLSAARGVFDAPILAKDFFLDVRQVAEARLAGADAILVMLSILDDGEARKMIEEAARFGMDALVEVHDEQEMRRALALGAPLIGINNRDLRDLSIDLSATERLAPLAGEAIVISESGIRSRSDIDRLARAVDGFLIGSSLMRAEDPADAARALLFGRVKLCGLNRPEDFAAAAPAAFAGLVFVAESPRALSMGQALRLTELGPKPVGVFRNRPSRDVTEAAAILGLHAVQLHGSEDEKYVAELRRALPEQCEIWRAIAVTEGMRPTSSGEDRILFDSGSGGTGRTFDWSQVRDDPRLPTALIAGGIGPDNVRQASRLGAYALDVGSAVDEAPGMKSQTKTRALFEALRPDGRQGSRQCA